MIKRIMCFSMFFAVMVMSSFAQDSICCPVASNLDQENTTITFQLSGTTTFTRAGIALSPFPGENPDVMMSIDGVGGPYQPGTNQMSIEIKYKGLQLYCSVYVTNSSGDSGRIFSEEIPITIPQNYVCCQEVSNLDQPDMTLNFQILKDPEQFGLGFFVWSTIPGIEFFKNNFQGGSSFVAPFQVGPNQKSIPTADIPRGIPIYYTVVYMGEYGYLFTEEASFTLPVANQAPVANAGAGQTVHSGTSVTLDGSLSTDPDGNIPLTYAWTILQKPSGSAAALATPNQVSTSINIDLPGEYRVRLIVTDSLGLASAPAQVIINSISVIPASEREALIALYNSTNGDGWLDNSGWKTPPLHTDGFAMPGTEGTWYGVYVTNGYVDMLYLLYNGLSGSIPSQLGNFSKLEDLDLENNQLSGPIPPELGNLSNLEDLYLQNNQLSGPIPAQLGNLSNMQIFLLENNYLSGVIPSELANLSSVNMLEIRYNCLSATDPTLRAWLDSLQPDWEAHQDHCLVVNQAPVANAGTGQTVHPGTSVTLDGSLSVDPDENYPLTYAWTLLQKPSGSAAALATPNLVSTSINIDLPGEYRVQLVVTDSKGLAGDPAEVTLSTFNTAPVAAAGNDKEVINLDVPVSLDGSQSWDDDGDPLTYLWTLVQKPLDSNAVISDPTSATPTITPDIYGDYTIQLVVSDPWESSTPGEVVVSTKNLPPIADAGNNQSCLQGDTVSFNGGASSDPNGDAITYSWQIVSKPDGSAAYLTGADSVTVSLHTDLAGEYVVALVVNDGLLDSSAATATVMATSYEDAVLQKLNQIITTLNDIPDSAFGNAAQKDNLTRKVSAILDFVVANQYQPAYVQLDNSVLQKLNGCAKTGTPDKNDWVIPCAYQNQVYPLVIEALTLLDNLF